MNNNERIKALMESLINSPKTLEAIKKYRKDKGEPPNIPIVRQFYLRSELLNIATNPIYCGNGCDKALLIQMASLCQELSIGAIDKD
jgi:hypothetical protein